MDKIRAHFEGVPSLLKSLETSLNPRLAFLRIPLTETTYTSWLVSALPLLCHHLKKGDKKKIPKKRVGV